MLQVSVIIVNYNVKEFLLNLLESLQKSLKNLSSEIIVVDNASDDGSIKAVGTRFPSVKIISNEKNLGFGVANNQGMRMASGKFIVLINPDTIVQEDTFTKLIDFFESNDQVSMAGCKVLNPDGTLQLSCRRGFPGPWTSFTKVVGLSALFPKSRIFARYNLTFLDENQTYEVDAISGAFMMFKREVYEKIGGFDPAFFMYGEDLDFCYRTKSAGLKVYYVHSTAIIHFKGESTKRSSIDETKVFYDAMHLFVKKHFSTFFLVEAILRIAIILRKLATFLYIHRIEISAFIIDFASYLLALLIAENVYQSESWRGFPPEVKPWIYIVPAFLQSLILTFAGSYKKSSLSILKSILALFAGFIFLSAMTFFLKQFAFSRAVLLINYIILMVIIPLWRIILKVFIRYGLTAESRKMRTIIVGVNLKAQQLSERLRSSYSSFHHIIGFIARSRKDLDKKIDGSRVIGSLENIRKIVINEKVDKVIISSEEISYNEMFTIVSNCQGLNIEFSVAGSDLDFLVGKSSITMLEEIPLLKIHYNISSLSHKITKSIFDIGFGIPILFFIFPIVYINSKITGRTDDFTEFILGIPGVCLGKKSLVGPDKNTHLPGLYLGKEGLTGLWYTENYDKSDDTETEKLNIFYARNQNIWLDIEILGKTFSKMFQFRS